MRAIFLSLEVVQFHLVLFTWRQSCSRAGQEFEEANILFCQQEKQMQALDFGAFEISWYVLQTDRLPPV